MSNVNWDYFNSWVSNCFSGSSRTQTLEYVKVGRRERRVNNYKEYSDLVLKRLLLFRKIKSYGFTLNESAQIISLLDADLASCAVISKTAGEKIVAINKKIEELKALKKLLKTSIESCENGGRAVTDEKNCPLFSL